MQRHCFFLALNLWALHGQILEGAHPSASTLRPPTKYLFLYTSEDDTSSYPSSYHGLNSQLLTFWQNAGIRIAAQATGSRVLVEPHVHVSIRNNSWFEVGLGNMNPSWTEFRSSGIIATVTEPLSRYADIGVLPFPNGIANIDTAHTETNGRVDFHFSADTCLQNKTDFHVRGLKWIVEGKTFCESDFSLEHLNEALLSQAILVAVEVTTLSKFPVISTPSSNFNLLPFAPQIVKKAKSFVANSLRGPFIAIHWRRGDRGFYLERQGPGVSFFFHVSFPMHTTPRYATNKIVYCEVHLCLSVLGKGIVED